MSAFIVSPDHIRQVFVPNGGTFTMNGIAPGRYDIRYRDLGTGGLYKSELIPLEQITDDHGTKFSVVRLTLYRIQGGNTSFSSLAEDDF